MRGHTSRQLDEIDKQTDRMDGKIDRQMGGHTDRWMDKQTEEWTNRQMDG
jgi:hypothetical protein